MTSKADATIVVDVGCRTQGPEHSTDKLLQRFSPRLYFGFDPDPGLTDGIVFTPDQGTQVFRRAAAWTHDGMIEYAATGITASVVPSMMEARPVLVPCFDFCRWLRVLPLPVIVKMDCEGAEYPLVEAIIGHGLDTMIDLLLIEWHHEYVDRNPGTPPHEELEAVLRCEVEPWE